ncbi:RICIN domain-containing protein [Streptomyces roseolus]|uniref:RICIN domain-containing protein n=1 Tax=Streptomyces roseolus TaxID=67358 RepID=UPI00378CECE3
MVSMYIRAPRRVIASISAAFVAGSIALTGTAAGAPSEPVNFTSFYEIRARHSDMCLDVAHQSKAHAADVIQGRCWGGWNQQWRVVRLDSGHLEIRARHSDMCLDVAHQSKAHAANVIQGRCWGGENQQWNIRGMSSSDFEMLPDGTNMPKEGAFVRIIARHSGGHLDVAHQSKAHAANVVQAQWWGGENQQWRFIKVG